MRNRPYIISSSLDASLLTEIPDEPLTENEINSYVMAYIAHNYVYFSRFKEKKFPNIDDAKGRAFYGMIFCAIECLRNDDNKGCMKHIEKMLAFDPNDHRGWLFLHLLYLKKGKTEKAELALQKAMKIDPNLEVENLKEKLRRDLERKFVGRLVNRGRSKFREFWHRFF